MTSLNRVTLIGRLGKDPEIQHFDSGVVKAAFAVATSEVHVNKEGNKVEQTEWHNVVMWRKLAEIAEKYLRKGKLVYIEGRLKTRSWEDKDGNKRFITEIDASNMIMLGAPEGGGGNGGGYGNSGSSNYGGGYSQRSERPNYDAPPPVESTGDVDDLPF